MAKQEVKLLIDDDRRLYVRQKDGKEYFVTIFEGGGYYCDIWLRTAEEIEENDRQRKEMDAKLKRESMGDSERASWYKRIFGR